MVKFRRNYVAGGSYFFTVTLRDRRCSLLTDNIDLLRESFRHMQQKSPIEINAIVVLPEHLHAIMTLPPGDVNYPKRWRMVKSHWVRSLIKRGYPFSKNHRGEYPVWQRRYWEHTIRDAEDYQQHVDYIHYNPVKHGLVDRALDWPYSSFHRYVAKGLLPVNWAESQLETKGLEFGE